MTGRAAGTAITRALGRFARLGGRAEEVTDRWIEKLEKRNTYIQHEACRAMWDRFNREGAFLTVGRHRPRLLHPVVRARQVTHGAVPS